MTTVYPEILLSDGGSSPAERTLRMQLLTAFTNQELLPLLQPASGPVRFDLLELLKDPAFPSQRLDEFLQEPRCIQLLLAAPATGNGPQRPPSPMLKPKLRAALARHEAYFSKYLQRGLPSQREFSDWLKWFLLEHHRLPQPAQWLWDELSGPAGSRFDAFLRSASLTELNLITADVAAEPGTERLFAWLNWLEAAASGHPPADAQVRDILKRLDQDRLFALLNDPSARAVLLNRWSLIKDQVVSGLATRLEGLIELDHLEELADHIQSLEEQATLLQPHQRLTLGEWQLVLARLRDLQRMKFAPPSAVWGWLMKSSHAQEERQQLEATARNLAKALWKLQLRQQPGDDDDRDSPDTPDVVQLKKTFLDRMLRKAWSPTIPASFRAPLVQKLRACLETGVWPGGKRNSPTARNAIAPTPGASQSGTSTAASSSKWAWVDYRQLQKESVRAAWIKYGVIPLLVVGVTFAWLKSGSQSEEQFDGKPGRSVEVAKSSPASSGPPATTQPVNSPRANPQPANTPPVNPKPVNPPPVNTPPPTPHPATPQPLPPDHGFVTEVEFVQRFHQVDREFLKSGRDIWETLAVSQPLKWPEVAAPLLNIPADRPGPRSVLIRGLTATNDWLAQQKLPRILAKYCRVQGVLNVELTQEAKLHSLARLTLKDRTLTYQAESGADPAVLNALSAFVMLEFLPQDATQEPYYAQLHRPVQVVLANLADARYPTIAELLSQSQPQPYFSRFWLNSEATSIQPGNLKVGTQVVQGQPNQTRLSAANLKLLFDSHQGTLTREATTTGYDVARLKAEIAKAAPDKKPRLEALLLQVQTLETDIAALQTIRSQMQSLKYEAPQGNSPGGFICVMDDGSKLPLSRLWKQFYDIWSPRYKLAEAATSNPPPSGVFWIGMMYNKADLEAYHKGLTELKNKEEEYNNQVKLLDNPQLPDDQRQKLTADRDKYQREGQALARRLVDPTLLGGLHQFAGSLEEKIKQWMKNPRDRYWANYPYSGYQTYLKKAIEHWDAECINRQCGEARIAERFQARMEEYVAQINLDARTGIEDRHKDIQATKRDIKDQIWDAPVSESSPNANIVLEYRYELFADLYRMVVDSAITVLQAENRQKSMELAGELGLPTGAQAPSGSLQGTVYAVVPDQGQRLMIRVIVPPGARNPGN